MNHLRNAALALVTGSVVLSSAVLGGCAAEEATTVKLDDELQEHAYTKKAGTLPISYRPVCPPSTTPRTRNRKVPEGTMILSDYQANATSAFAYILGAENPPFTPPARSLPGSCEAARACMDEIRVGLGNALPPDNQLSNKAAILKKLENLGIAPQTENSAESLLPNSIILKEATPGRACDLPANIFEIHMTNRDEQPAATKVFINNCSMFLDQCLGTGTSGFFSVMDAEDDSNTTRILIDPQPAQATASLTGSTGATAAAVFVNTETPTTILKWDASYAPGSTAAAGTPCSVTDLGVNATTQKVIQVFGSNRRCF